MNGSFGEGDIGWFLNGQLNVCYNCVDRYALNRETSDQTAIIWEGDEGQNSHITYSQLLVEVCKVANVLKKQGVQKVYL